MISIQMPHSKLPCMRSTLTPAERSSPAPSAAAPPPAPAALPELTAEASCRFAPRAAELGDSTTFTDGELSALAFFAECSSARGLSTPLCLRFVAFPGRVGLARIMAALATFTSTAFGKVAGENPSHL